jgi:hypothetical protein
LPGPSASHRNDKAQPRILLNNVTHDRFIVKLAVLSGEDPPLCLSESCKMTHLDLIVARDEHDHNSPDFLEGKKGKDVLVPIGQLDQDAISLLEAESQEAQCQSVYLVPKIAIGVTNCVIDERYLGGIQVCGFVEHIPPRHPKPPSQPVVLFRILFLIGGKSFKHQPSSPWFQRVE